MKTKITSRLTRNFTLVFILFGAVVLILFTTLFRQYVVRYHEDELVRHARLVAQQFGYTFEELAEIRNINDDVVSDAFRRHMMNQSSDSPENLWLVTKGGDLVMERPGIVGNLDAAMAALEEPMKTTAEGREFIGEIFTDKDPVVSVGVPIYYENVVVGAAFFHARVSALPQTLETGKEMLLVSLIFSTLLAAFVIRILASRFTKPIKKMQRIAERMTLGDYAIKTNIKSKDEIGSLARSLDDLSRKLLSSSEESAKLEKMRNDFIVNISHELRTPVTVIRGSLEALRDGVIPEEDLPAYYDSLFSESVHLGRLVNDLLELSRLQNVDFEIVKEPVDLIEILSEVRRAMERIAAPKHIAVELDTDTQSYRMQGDYVRLRQMFLNLMDNAVKFSPEGSTVTLFFHSDENSVRTGVRDQGSGMSPEEVEHIFDRFYKRDEENPTGVGLGLSIVREIAKRHDFNLVVESVENEGSTFTFVRTRLAEEELAE